MNDGGAKERNQLPIHPSGRPKASIAFRLFEVASFAYFTGCIIEFMFITKVFGLKPAIALSFVLMLPFILSIHLHRRWKSLKATDWVLLAIVLTVALIASRTIVGRWYESGWHFRPGEWTFFTPPSEEDRAWDKFVQQLRKDSKFRFIEHRRLRGVNWLKGKLESEEDLERLVDLAKKNGIDNRKLDGPYQHSISITIPGTKRAQEYH